MFPVLQGTGNTLTHIVLAQTEIRQLINSYDHPTSDSVRHL